MSGVSCVRRAENTSNALWLLINSPFVLKKRKQTIV